eukprot:523252-Hanusia_phi.AAC.2
MREGRPTYETLCVLAQPASATSSSSYLPAAISSREVSLVVPVVCLQQGLRRVRGFSVCSSLITLR